MDNQRHRQHWVHITQNEDKQNKKHNTEKYKDEQHGPPQKKPPMVEHRCLRTSPCALPSTWNWNLHSGNVNVNCNGTCIKSRVRRTSIINCMMTMKLPGWANMLSNLIRKCRRLITHFQRYPSFFTIQQKSEFN
jgi:hypothetical protein